MQRVLNPGSLVLKASALTTGPHCLLISGQLNDSYQSVLFMCRFIFLSKVVQKYLVMTANMPSLAAILIVHGTAGSIITIGIL